MKEFQMDIHLSCPWCGGSEILADRRTKATISVQCAKCKKIYKADLDSLKTEKAKAQKRMGAKKIEKLTGRRDNMMVTIEGRSEL